VIRQLFVQLPTYADNVALPAFARRCCSNRSISFARRSHTGKPAAAGLLLWAHAGTDRRTDAQTDEQTDTVPFYRPCSAFYHCTAYTVYFHCLHVRLLSVIFNINQSINQSITTLALPINRCIRPSFMQLNCVHLGTCLLLLLFPKAQDCRRQRLIWKSNMLRIFEILKATLSCLDVTVRTAAADMSGETGFSRP